MCELRHTSALSKKCKVAKKTQGTGDHLGRGLIPFFNPSLEDCPDELNSRWRRASAALPEGGRACARSRPGGDELKLGRLHETGCILQSQEGPHHLANQLSRNMR